MSLLEDARQAAVELADEANANGNDWETLCRPKLDLILKALAEPEAARISVPVLDCPCGNVGFYVVPNRNTGEPEQEQCEFCYTVENSRFNVERIASIPSPLLRSQEKSDG